MKGAMLALVGVGGIGAFAVTGGGSSLPNDYVGTVNKSPEAVYSAFSALGPESEVSIEVPMASGVSRTMTQRLIKVPNEQVKLELEIDGQAIVTADVQIAPEGEKGTRIAAELDFNGRAMSRLIVEEGGPTLPPFAFQEGTMDRAFARMMAEMVERIEAGKPLLSLGETHARWGQSETYGGTGPGSAAQAAARSRQYQASRPAVSARPQLDPNAAAKRPVGSTTFEQ